MAGVGEIRKPHALETIGVDLASSVRSQSLTAESEAGEKPMHMIGHNSSVTVWPQPHQKKGGPKTLKTIP